MTLAARAPGKVNVCLFVGRPRDDGLHPLVSVVQAVSLADDLVLEPAPAGRADEVICPGVEGANLAARALAAFREHTGWGGAPRRLTITKRVPLAAGMGGGSSDAATTLRLTAHAAGLPVPRGIAMGLGADVPVLLEPGRALMTGAGEHVASLGPSGDADTHAFVVLPLDAALGARDVYLAFDALDHGRSPAELAELEQTVREAADNGRALPAELVVNDLQAAACALCPAIEPALAAARATEPLAAFVSGSGPTVVALYADGGQAERAAANLREHGHPRAQAVTAVGPEFAAVRRTPAPTPAGAAGSP